MRGSPVQNARAQPIVALGHREARREVGLRAAQPHDLRERIRPRYRGLPDSRRRMADPRGQTPGSSWLTHEDLARASLPLGVGSECTRTSRQVAPVRHSNTRVGAGVGRAVPETISFERLRESTTGQLLQVFVDSPIAVPLPHVDRHHHRDRNAHRGTCPTRPRALRLHASWRVAGAAGGARLPL